MFGWPKRTPLSPTVHQVVTGEPLRPTDIYPYVVPLSYFELPPDAGLQPSIEKFGIVRHLGHDVAMLLVQISGNLLKNIHAADAEAIGLDLPAVQELALNNLSSLIADGKSFNRRITKTPSGFNYIVWMGDRLASTCILWPGLYDWARKLLETDDVLVTIPQQQFMFVVSRGDAEFRAGIRQYVRAVVAGMDKRISDEWFVLGPSGIAPFIEAQLS